MLSDVPEYAWLKPVVDMLTTSSEHKLMITLCLACHTKVTRTLHLRQEWPSLLRTLWREQHPKGHEQVQLDFTTKKPAAKPVSLFGEKRKQVAEDSLLG